MEVLKNCLTFAKTEDVPSKTCVSTSLEEILEGFWRFPILQAGKRIHFLFPPLSVLAKKAKNLWERFHSLSTLNVVFLDYTFLRHIAHPGKARHEGHIRTALGIPFFLVCSVSITLLFSSWGIIDMFLCTLSFHSSRQQLRHPFHLFCLSLGFITK